jgi:hypothetical protein
MKKVDPEFEALRKQLLERQEKYLKIFESRVADPKVQKSIAEMLQSKK